LHGYVVFFPPPPFYPPVLVPVGYVVPVALRFTQLLRLFGYRSVRSLIRFAFVRSWLRYQRWLAFPFAVPGRLHVLAFAWFAFTPVCCVVGCVSFLRLRLPRLVSTTFAGYVTTFVGLRLVFVLCLVYVYWLLVWLRLHGSVHGSFMPRLRLVASLRLLRTVGLRLVVTFTTLPVVALDLFVGLLFSADVVAVCSLPGCVRFGSRFVWRVPVPRSHRLLHVLLFWTTFYVWNVLSCLVVCWLVCTFCWFYVWLRTVGYVFTLDVCYRFVQRIYVVRCATFTLRTFLPFTVTVRFCPFFRCRLIAATVHVWTFGSVYVRSLFAGYTFGLRCVGWLF